MVLQLCGASEGKAWTCLSCKWQLWYRPQFHINQHTFTWSKSSFVSKNKISFPKSKWKRNCWQHGPFTLYWPHLNKHPPSPHNFRCPSSHILFRFCWVKALCLPSFNKMPVHSSWGFHVSPNTERLGQKKSPPERNPICVLIHSAGLDMSKQLAFTALATLFTSNWQTIWIYTHTESGSLTADPTPSHELREINVLVVAYRTKLPGSLRSWQKSHLRSLEILTEGNPIFWRYFEKHCV